LQGLTAISPPVLASGVLPREVKRWKPALHVRDFAITEEREKIRNFFLPSSVFGIVFG
jgi:hypothetical protein